MKYTIELTEKQRKRFKHMNKALIKMGMGFDILSLLEPIKTTNVEDTSEYQIGYKAGRKDGFAYCKNNTELIEELKQAEYKKGYNSAINDYNAMYEWLHDCFADFEKFLLEKGFYTDEKFSDGFVVGQLMYDLICDHDIAEVISEFQKWQEEKKKAEDEIKIGDEVIITGLKDSETIGVITMLANNNYAVICLINGSEMARVTKNDIKSTGRHFEEVEQLLDKLRGEDNE